MKIEFTHKDTHGVDRFQIGIGRDEIKILQLLCAREYQTTKGVVEYSQTRERIRTMMQVLAKALR